jgi:vitamin B12 transporter
MKLRKLLSIFIIAVILMKTFSASAQEDTIALEPIEVKAMRTATSEKRIPSSVTIITREDIEKRQARTVADVLKGALGIDVSPSGGMGATTSVFMRGNESNATMVIIDGARVNIGSTGLFDFGHLTADNIEKIEILRGSQSTLWGQDAMGGVINIITRKGKGDPTHSLSFEAGSYGTYKESIQSLGTVDKYDYSLSLSRLDIFDQFSADSSWRGPTEDDPYKNTTISTRFGYDYSNKKRIELMGRWSKGLYNYDKSSGVDDDRFGNNDQVQVAMPFKMEVNDQWNFTLTPAYAYRDNLSVSTSTKEEWVKYHYFDKTTSLDLQNNLEITKELSLIFGGEYRNQATKSVGNDYNIKFDNWSNFVQASYDYKNPENEYKNFLLTTGYRHDYHSNWDNNVTYKFGAGYYLPKTNTQFNTSWATAFVSPTTDQLWYPPVATSANPNLLPEENKSFEFGIKQIVNKRTNMTITFFNDSHTNKIANDSDFIPQNIAKAHSRGIETGINLGLPKNFNLALNHTWNEHYDQDNRPLIRRAKTKFNATLTHTWKEKLDSLLNIYVRGRATDTSLLKHTGGYTVVRAALGYKFNKKLKLTLRGENLFNEEYEIIYPAGTPGISGYAGFTYTFN